MAVNPVVSGLPDYVEQHTPLMIRNVSLGASTIKYMQVMTGAIGSTAMNILDTKVELQDGSTCGFTSKGSTTYSQRILKTGVIKVNNSFCPEALIGKYLQNEVALTPGKEKIPFEQSFTDGINTGISNAVETMIWQGDTDNASENLKRFDGFIKIAQGESGVVKVAISNTATAIEAVKKMLAKIPAKELRKDTRMFCSPAFLMKYTQELVEKNLYHFAPGDAVAEFMIPGTLIILTAVGGLSNAGANFDGKEYIAVANEDNLVYGTDLESGKDEYKLWYSDDADEFRLKARFTSGVNFRFPDMFVLGEIAAPAKQ